MPQLRSSLPRDVAHSVAWIVGGLLQLCITACQTNFQRLQRVQNARIVCQAPRRHHHSADLLKDLHWLHVRGRVDYKQDCRPLLQSRKTATTFASYTFIYSLHIDYRVFWGHLRQTYCQHSLHRQTLLLDGSRAVPPPFGTVFPYLRYLFRHSDKTQIQMQIQIQNKN